MLLYDLGGGNDFLDKTQRALTIKTLSNLRRLGGQLVKRLPLAHGHDLRGLGLSPTSGTLLSGVSASLSHSPSVPLSQISK